MKTERMVLLVTPEEKARISAEAGKLGVSGGEYIRKLIGGFDADDLTALDELKTLWPEVDAAIERMTLTLDRTINRLEESEARRAHYNSDEYREQVRRELVESGIDWDAARRRFRGGADREAA